MGPDGFQEALVYLRTAVSVDPKGWAKFDYVRMPDYRWGILLAPKEDDRKSHSEAVLRWSSSVPAKCPAIVRHTNVVEFGPALRIDGNRGTPIDECFLKTVRAVSCHQFR